MPGKIRFIDSHCHFDFHDFDVDRDACWQRCLKQGVQSLIIPGVEPDQWPRVARLCGENKGWRFAVGLHPWWINRVKFSITSLQNRLAFYVNTPGCTAIGECGLDANIDTPMRAQCDILELHLALAIEQQLPVIVHCVKAQNELLQCLKNFSGVRGVIHAFSGSDELARQFWRRGFYLGVGGTITYPRAKKTRQAITAMPLESLLLETDAPDIPLLGRQGERNSPEFLPRVAEALARLKKIEVKEVARVTTANAATLFDRL